MSDSTATRNAVLTMLGGALWTLALPLRSVRPVLGIPPRYFGVAVGIPVLLGFGVLEIRARYRERYGPVGRAGVVLTGLGLGLLAVAILLLAVFYPDFVLGFVFAAVPGSAGVVALSLGSAFLAAALYRLGVVGPAAALLVGLGAPLTVPGVVLLRELVSASLDPLRVTTGLATAPYGVGWVLVGHRLRETAGEEPGADRADRRESVDVSPQVAVAAVVGATYLLFGAGRFLPLGPLSADWLATGSAALDTVHLLVGGAGIAVAALRNARVARAYNAAVGVFSLLVAPAGLLDLASVGGLGWLPSRGTLVNVVLHLPAGVVGAAVGFGLDGETDIGVSASESE